MGRPRTGTLYFSGKSWKARVPMPDGTRPNFDLDTNVRSEAEKRKARLIAQLDSGVATPKVHADPTRFSEYAKVVNKRRVDEGIVSAPDEWQRLSDYVFPIIGPLVLSEIKPKHVRDVLSAAGDRGLSKQTVRHIRNAVYKVLRHAVVDELVTENVVAKVDPPKIREIVKERAQLDDAEFGALMRVLTEECGRVDETEVSVMRPPWLRNNRTREAAERWAEIVADWSHSGLDRVEYAKKNGLRVDSLKTWTDRAAQASAKRSAVAYGRQSHAHALRLMCACARSLGGMRTGDIVRWDWVMLEKPAFSQAIIPRSKTEKPHRLGVPVRLRPMLLDWWRRSGSPTSGPVFPVLKGARRGQRQHLRGVSFADRLREACRAAGLTRKELYEETDYTLPVDFHSFRRAFVTACHLAGIRPEIAMRMSAHSDRDIHEGYIGGVQEVPDAVVPELPTMPVTAEDARLLTPPDPSCTAMTLADPVTDGSDPARHSGFEPLAFGSGGRRNDPSCTVLAPIDPAIQAAHGPVGSTEGHQGMGFRLVVPSPSSSQVLAALSDPQGAQALVTLAATAQVGSDAWDAMERSVVDASDHE